jgi:hypothetical protein
VVLYTPLPPSMMPYTEHAPLSASAAAAKAKASEAKGGGGGDSKAALNAVKAMAVVLLQNGDLHWTDTHGHTHSPGLGDDVENGWKQTMGPDHMAVDERSGILCVTQRIARKSIGNDALRALLLRCAVD